MDVASPQFVYMVLILPTLFGLTLVGEGIARVMRSQWAGWTRLISLLLLTGVVVLAYFILSDLV